MTKAKMIERLLALGLTLDLSHKSAAELSDLIEENDPEFRKARLEDDGDNDGSASTGDDPRTGKKITCRIENSSEPGGKEDVFAGVNGFTFLAKRGQWIELDEGFVNHLRGISVTDIVPVMGPNGRPTGEIHEVPRSRYQVTLK